VALTGEDVGTESWSPREAKIPRYRLHFKLYNYHNRKGYNPRLVLRKLAFGKDLTKIVGTLVLERIKQHLFTVTELMFLDEGVGSNGNTTRQTQIRTPPIK
jgi:hypothetical protein